MKWIKVTALTMSIIILIGFAGIVYLPIKNIKQSDCTRVSGVIQKVVDHGNFDIGLYIRNDEKRYYINRGQEQGLSVDCLSKTIVGKDGEIWYVNKWTPFDPYSTTFHIAHVCCNGQVIFNEIQDWENPKSTRIEK